MTDDPELTVLVVDDDFMVASIHTRFVARTPGYRVVGTAATGETALCEIARLMLPLTLRVQFFTRCPKPSCGVSRNCWML